MKSNFNNYYTYDGKNILFKDMIFLIKKIIKNNHKLYIGSDSQVIKDKVIFVVSICLYEAGKGGTYFYLKYKDSSNKYKTKRMRLIEEAFVAAKEAYLFEEMGIKVAEVHLDISTKKSAYSSRFGKEASNIVKAYGLKPKLKPKSWASGVADWHTKR